MHNAAREHVKLEQKAVVNMVNVEQPSIPEQETGEPYRTFIG